MFDSPWSTAGNAWGDFSFHHSLPGICIRDYRQRRDDGSEFLAHEVFQQQSDGGIWLFGFDTFGYPPLEPARGEFNDGTLTLVKITPRGRARHRWIAAETLDYWVDIAVADSAEFIPFLRASYQSNSTV